MQQLYLGKLELIEKGELTQDALRYDRYFLKNIKEEDKNNQSNPSLTKIWT